MDILNCYSIYDLLTKNRFAISPAIHGVSTGSANKTQDSRRFHFSVKISALIFI
ncbi:hypothetical protein SAMN04487891_11725 [Flagellimonas taeanensis]|uniref:Uncharacterized protein n=1 Tax=Flagellimonas taeanensis TaxID=1005926 RepID=A0A1M7CQT9_9FLAO|nr:hypothetical protein SAMN04487891_11725 [Allomuricauda taeanensis]SHL69641.1 hypothetical protein SAMN05216293_4089 [Allomuricauda taeanensis]